MLRLPRTISFRRFSPGTIAGPIQPGSLVIVLDRNFEGMAALPSERHTILVVHANPESSGHSALQTLQPISRRDSRSSMRTATSSQARSMLVRSASCFAGSAPDPVHRRNLTATHAVSPLRPTDVVSAFRRTTDVVSFGRTCFRHNEPQPIRQRQCSRDDETTLRGIPAYRLTGQWQNLHQRSCRVTG